MAIPLKGRRYASVSLLRIVAFASVFTFRIFFFGIGDLKNAGLWLIFLT